MARYSNSCAEPPDDGSHPYQETRNWHAADIALRAAGFRIAARPKRGPDIWTRAGQRYTATEALAIARCEQKGVR